MGSASRSIGTGFESSHGSSGRRGSRASPSSSRRGDEGPPGEARGWWAAFGGKPLGSVVVSAEGGSSASLFPAPNASLPAQQQ